MWQNVWKKEQEKMKQISEAVKKDQILYYFKTQWPVLLAVTFSGLIYNLGLLAGPWFEGRMTGCLVDILGGKAGYQDMLVLVTAYVMSIAIVQISRYIKRFYVRRFANNVNRDMKEILYRSLVHNMVVGVTDGFSKTLELVGTGYRAQAEGGKKLTINIGFSHPVILDAPENIQFETPNQTTIVVKGINKQQVGNLAADIRAIRKPEPYLGKGIKYVDEHIRRKEGKTGK